MAEACTLLCTFPLETLPHASRCMSKSVSVLGGDRRRTSVRCLSTSGQADTFNDTVGLEVQCLSQRPPDLGSGGQD